MLTRRNFTLASLAWATAGCEATQPLGASFGNLQRSKLVAEATSEGTVRIDSATGVLYDAELTDTFKRLYPGITLDYRRANSSALHANFLKEATAGRPTADILISSAMDLQFKLVNDGFAQTYASPEKPYLPEWAVWNDQAYTVVADPLVFAYNKTLMPAEDIPYSHEELIDLLRRKPGQYRGKVASYSPERSGTGYLYYTQDLMLSRDTVDLVRAVARAEAKFYISGGEAGNKIVTGEHLLAYNLVNSNMVERTLQYPHVGLVFPNDYTLVMSRVAFIPRTARHLAAGKLFLDFLLSELGQKLMAAQHMQPIRTGVPAIGASPPPEVIRRIRFGPALLANLDEYRRRRVLYEWRRAFEA